MAEDFDLLWIANVIVRITIDDKLFILAKGVVFKPPRLTDYLRRALEREWVVYKV
jgi:L-lysine 2,3-aminomutase